MSTPILERLVPRFDSVVESIYRAGSGLMPWLAPIAEIADIFDAWSVQLLGVNKKTGVLSFCFEAGSAPPEAPVEYLRYYHLIDPRLDKRLPAPVGEWMSCEEHFDEAFVESNPFYKDFLIPLGGRYLYGTKLHEDESSAVVVGHLSKAESPPLTREEKAAFARFSAHFGRALDIRTTLDSKLDPRHVGTELLERMRQPMLLIDNQRRISYRNRSASALLARRDLIDDRDGSLACGDADSDLELTIAIRSLGLVPTSSHGDRAAIHDRRVVRLRRRDGRSVAATLLALRPGYTLGSFGPSPQALFTVFEPGVAMDVDPYLLSMTFDLSPAEARLAAMIVNGRTTAECARELVVRMSTIRSQLVSIYRKTRATGQADLVRMVLSASAL